MKAGAKVGWMRPFDEYGACYLFPNIAVDPQAGDVPAFQWKSREFGVLAKLPIPRIAFGLHFTTTNFTDRGLREVARLKTLQVLLILQLNRALKQYVHQCFAKRP